MISIFRQKENKKFLLFKFLITVFLLSVATLSLPVDQISQANAETLQINSTAYPTTPEGVVKAFAEENLGDVPVSIERDSLCNQVFNLVEDKYLPDDDDLKANRKTRAITSDSYGTHYLEIHIATGYQKKQFNKTKNKATVKVLYKRLGWLWEWPKITKECRFSQSAEDKQKTDTTHPLLESAAKMVYKQKGMAGNKERCKFLYITNDTKEVVYHLAKPGKFWRFAAPHEPYISVSSAIKQLRCFMTEFDPRVQKAYPSEKQKIEIKKDIETLEKYLKNADKGGER